MDTVFEPLRFAPTTVLHIAHYLVMLVEHSLPFQRDLLVTTPNAVYRYSHIGSQILFQCEDTAGIAMVRAATDNSGLLAIAGHHITLLHDAAHPRQRGHKFGRGEVKVMRLCLPCECGLTVDAGCTACPSFLARFADPILQYFTRYLDPLLLADDRLLTSCLPLAPFAAECCSCVR